MEKQMIKEEPSSYLENLQNQKIFRFSWIKRNPFANFSYDEFMAITNQLTNLSEKYETNETADQNMPRLGDNEITVYDNRHSFIVERRSSSIFDEGPPEPKKRFSIEDFTAEDYKKYYSPTAHISLPRMNTLILRAEPVPSSSNLLSKRKLEFCGNLSNGQLYSEILKQYRKFSLDHSKTKLKHC